MTIIQVYATTTYAEEEVGEFYHQVQLWNWDWNAKVGNTKKENVVELYSFGNWNEKGDQFTNFFYSNDFFTANPVFKQPRQHLYIWTSPDDVYRNQIDYIIAKRKLKSSIRAWKAWPGVDCGKDHKVLFGT